MLCRTLPKRNGIARCLRQGSKGGEGKAFNESDDLPADPSKTASDGLKVIEAFVGKDDTQSKDDMSYRKMYRQSEKAAQNWTEPCRRSRAGLKSTQRPWRWSSSCFSWVISHSYTSLASTKGSASQHSEGDVQPHRVTRSPSAFVDAPR